MRNNSREKIAQESAQSYRDRLPPGERAFIYIIQAGEFIKIGWSENARNRLSGIQHACPLECRLITAFEVPADLARKLEGLFHWEFCNRHTRGEWFQMDAQETAAHMLEMLEEAFPPAPPPKPEIPVHLLHPPRMPGGANYPYFSRTMREWRRTVEPQLERWRAIIAEDAMLYQRDGPNWGAIPSKRELWRRECVSL